MVEMVEPNSCIRGCCRSETIPLHLPPSSYSLISPIARGSESVVYEATLEGRRVAVKKPRLSTSDDLDRFHKQLQILCELDHPGIATLVAAHAKPPNYMFFFEFYERGSLAEMVHEREWSPKIDEALSIVIGLAKCLEYMHHVGIAHRDVKAANILLDPNLQPHLIDFGLAAYKKDIQQTSAQNWRSSGKPKGGFHKKNMVGTLIYMAPEILRKEVFTEKSDVYSFAITINELLTGVVPYTDLRAEAQAHTVLEMNYTEQQLTAAIVSEGLRPILASPDSSVSVHLVLLVRQCWDMDPQNRPSFNDIVQKLQSIMETSKNGLDLIDALPDFPISKNEAEVMASDGLWDVFRNEEVVNLIKDTVKEPGMCAKRLATEAIERGSNDNITVIVVFLRLLTTAERIF